MGIFRRKKENTEMKIELSEGLYLGRPQNIGRQRPLLNCLPKGILVFLVVFGSLGGFLSAFDTECNYVLPGIVLFLCAMYFSGLFAFKKKRYKDIGYIIYFFFFVVTIYMFKSYVNSGFAAIVNVVRQRGEVYFNLDTGTEFMENIDDRYLTVTITLIFIGMFQVILLNIFVSNYMSLKLAIFMSVPMYIIPLYFQSEPNLFFVLCMLCGYMGIYILKNNGHFQEPEGRHDFEKEKNRKKLEISYTQNNRIYGGILLGALLCAMVVGVFALFFDSKDLEKYYKENEYKTATREGVSGFVMLGFRSFFPNLYSGGGMSGGYLGNISAIRPDNETDLRVCFTPYSTDPVYLKGYTGLRYDTDHWLDGYTLMGGQKGNSPYFYTESMANEAEQLSKEYKKDKETNSKGVMEVTNVGAAVGYVYYPYFTKFGDYNTYIDSSIFVGNGLNQTERFTYYPNIDYRAEVKDMESYVYLEVPASNEGAIDDFLSDAGISKEDPDAVDKVVAYLATEYSYSYTPGRMPMGGDFVNYFLEDNKKGVCAHFASAATLIFRRLGIPARYVEGYAFGYGKVLEGKVREDLDYDDYYSGYSKLGKTAVMEIEVTDANAHAWVEIYKKGKGWVIIDPTPSAMEGGDSTGNFWDSVRDMWENSPDVNIDGDISQVNLSFLDSDGMRFVGCLLLVLAILVFVVWMCVVRILRWRQWHTSSLRQNMLWYYREFCRRRSRRDATFGRLSMPSEQIAYIVEKQSGKKKGKESIDADHIIRCLEEICFSPAEPRREEYDYVIRVLRRM